MNKFSISKYIKSIKSFIINYKVWSIIILVVLVFIGFKIFGSKVSAETRYVTTTVTKNTVVSSVSGSGQVEASSTIDLKPKVSGDVVVINAKAGATVKKGQTLFVLDSGDTQKSLRDARLNLQIAENDLANAKKDRANTKATQDLNQKNLLLALNSSVVAIPDDNNSTTNAITLTGSYTSIIQGRYTLEVYSCQKGVCIKYSGLEEGTFPISVNIPEALGTRGFYVSFTSIPKSGEKWYLDVPSPASNSYASNLKAYEDGKISIPQAIDNADTTIASRQLALTQKQNALADIEQDLSDYYITAPFDGTIATVDAKLGQQSSSTTALGTIITNDKLASITLNEVDVAKIKLGEKVTLTFDAIDGLSIAGEVVEIDSVGTITQGVVDYTVKISFATDDDRVKAGMSTTAAIVTGVAQDVLTVPNSALKAVGGAPYVEAFDEPLAPPLSGAVGSVSSVSPRQVGVEVGLSNDTMTEVTSGLKEGDIVVSKTISGSATKTTTAQAPSIFGSQPARGGGATRVQGR